MAGNGSTRREHGKHEAFGSPKVQLSNLLAGQNHRGAKFGMGALEVSHRHFRLEYQAARRRARSPDAARSSASISGDIGSRLVGRMESAEAAPSRRNNSWSSERKTDNWSCPACATVGEDRRQAGQTCPVLLANAGREPSDAAAVWGHGVPNRSAAAAHRIGCDREANRAKEESGEIGVRETA
jgi:hypothetical protein